MKRILYIIGFVITTLCVSQITVAPAYAHIPAKVLPGDPPSLAPMLEQVTPAVVNISVEGTKVTHQRIPDLFGYFFGPQEQTREQPFRGLGSGVIIDAAKGYVVTNNHVIDSATDIRVTLTDGRSFKAQLVGADPEADIALIQLDNPKKLTQLSIGDSDNLRVGDFVVAIGNPFGLGQTVTSGIVSALGRGGLGMERLENFIQTDAAINRGNSGGALVDLHGNLIGINTAILGSAGNIGIGFAIPSNMMRDLIDQMIEFGEVRRGTLGVRGRDLDQQLADALGIEQTFGAWIAEVVEDSAAAEAGLQAGDVIISLNDRNIHSMSELAAKVGAAGEGKKATLGIVRQGKNKKVTVTLKGSEQASTPQVLDGALQGAQLQDLPKKGIEVQSVASNSPAAQVGLREGDVIIAVNRRPVQSVKELQQYIQQSNDVIALSVVRGKQSLYILLPY